MFKMFINHPSKFQGGLTVVDIYSEWAGPCTAMAGALKKIKLEVSGENTIFMSSP